METGATLKKNAIYIPEAGMSSTVCGKLLPESGTWFASAARSSAADLQELADCCLHNPVTQAILASVEGYALILNEQRQVVAVNTSALAYLNVDAADELVGLRPGEAFGCSHHDETPGGCGTSKSCLTCGAVIAILSSQTLNRSATGECLMSVYRDGVFEAHEYSIRATPLQIANNTLCIFLVHDISSTKRRDALDNIFIHDLNNIITGLRGWSNILVKRPQDAPAIAQRIVNLSSHLTQEVDNQRFLLLAERGELKVTLESVLVSDIVEGLRSFFSGHPPYKVNSLVVHEYQESATVRTCLPLLTRVLANMVKNALEAIKGAEQVEVRFEFNESAASFVVHNPGEIPEAVALQIFKRSFSTKSPLGRGLGTYSMKLFGEQYLGGTVGFSTNENHGTSFHINLPLAE